ncbi:prenylated Rab acceptor 1 [Coccidioides posadasii str. Silveira]|uniref:Prenylated Rab acceptor 1 n=1 Tax=Coccidioides posadasii (strain RMSCC 757 / Silveira) TaxID=443226 RepID=E9DG50_COCPS|nr:prenylated Rab acceptor 1 [Coccidioides posadasii str. Silveira]
MAYWRYRRNGPGTRRIHGQTDRECFFRGGGLGGRPRTPYDMPQWGRPPGARMGRSKKGKKNRVDRLEGDGDDSGSEDGVPLQPSVALGRQQMNHLRLAVPVDMMNGLPMESDGESSDDEHDEYALNEAYQDSTLAYAMQLAMKDRDDRLVERALERIRHAQTFGKSKVKLSQRELEALERRRMQREMINGSRGSKSARVNGRNMLPPVVLPAQSNGRWSQEAAFSSATDTASGYYMPTLQAPQARPRTPTQTLRMHQPNTSPRIPGAYNFQDDPSGRPPSSGKTQPLPRPLPDDPDWVPRSRSSSNAIPMSTSTYVSYSPAQVMGFDPRYSMSTSPGYNMSTAPDSMYQPVYRPSSRQSYIDPAAYNHVVLPPAPGTNPVRHPSSGSNASSSDNGVQIEAPKEPPKANGSKTNGVSRGKATRGRRTRK